MILWICLRVRCWRFRRSVNPDELIFAMSNVVPIYRETTPAGQPEPFYVPFFQVKIEGRKLVNNVFNDITQVTYTDKVDDLDSFEITVNNWDAEALRFKYEPPINV